ncbi:Hypothetical protein PHPALM_6420 [Phytophthora palmivora]|uniref:Uncharacterized protein n=1 Tax=Phytophthora palmivora TaxID=4796 RepID=A0A2P4YEV0_9STRA|nr:Hypothetical protein PHPALM_6420 [Phytophthora palmivora]
MSKPDFKYRKRITMCPNYFAGYRSVDNTDIYGSNTSLRFAYELLYDTYLFFGDVDGEYQDLVMWEQLTDAARGALNDNNNFGKAEVPLNEGNYEKHLENAWPL